MSVELLNSLTDVAGAIFLAQAASIALLDPAEGELVFEAVSGRGRDRLVGARFPVTYGVAGHVMSTGKPVVIDNLMTEPRFARNIAEETGYVPGAMMAAPLLRGGGGALGVLTVLDRGRTGRTAVQDLALLTKFARQAAISVELDRNSRGIHPEPPTRPTTRPGLDELAAAITKLPAPRAAAADRLLDALHDLVHDPVGS